jgi:hypothetical protein
MSVKRRHLLAGAAAGAALTQLPRLSSAAAGGEPVPAPAARPTKRQRTFAPSAPLKGMTVSCPTYGPVWGSPLMSSTLDDLKTLGVEWVSIHPYGRIRKSGDVGLTDAQGTGFLARCCAMCRDAGVGLFYKPHLAYWGSFSWRGAITFDTEAAWARFFRSYRAYIVDHASFAEKHKLPLLSVGVELDKTMHRPEWRDIIAAVRERYAGPITYAANWDAVGRVPFWDAVDVIGVQGYFPVGPALTGAPPARATLVEGWKGALAQLAGLSATHGKKVLFTELGYPRGTDAANEPWKAADNDDDRVIAHRAALMDVALEVLPRQPWYAGAFWWKWMPGPTWGNSDFSMKDAEARSVLTKRWAKG